MTAIRKSIVDEECYKCQRNLVFLRREDDCFGYKYGFLDIGGRHNFISKTEMLKQERKNKTDTSKVTELA